MRFNGLQSSMYVDVQMMQYYVSFVFAKHLWLKVIALSEGLNMLFKKISDI